MVFWFFVAALALVVIITFVLNMGWGNSIGECIGYSVASGVAGAVMLGISFMAVCGINNNANAEYKFVGEKTVSLKSLGTTTSLQGRSYYLGGGYLGSERVLNYATQDTDGYVRLTSAPAWASTIKEDAGAGEARVKILDVEKRQDWLWPWVSSSYKNYEFHVPAGSVVDTFVVDNK